MALQGLLPHGPPAFFHLDWICGPLKIFAEGEDLSFGAILTRLPILAERFEHTYKKALPLTWPLFRTDVDMFTALISTPAVQYTKQLTASDKQDFDLLCPKALRTSDAQVDRLLIDWQFFGTAVAESCKAYPLLNHRIDEIADVSRIHDWTRHCC